MIILTFGDSITLGLWDSKGGWADRLKSHIQSTSQPKHTVYNLGIDGNTTRQLLARFDSEIHDRLWPDAQYGFIFAIGTNDTLHRDHTEYESSPEEYASQITKLIGLARKYSVNILFLNILPVDEALTNPLLGSSTGKCYTNDRIDQFNQALYHVCDQESLPCLKISESFRDADYKTLLKDGLHPNYQGHELIYERVLSQVESWLN